MSSQGDTPVVSLPNKNYTKGVSVSDHYTEHPSTYVNQESLVSVWDDDDTAKEASTMKVSSSDKDLKEQLEQVKEAYTQEEQHQANTKSKMFCLTISSNIWFLIGSVFYVWLAAIDLQWEKAIGGIPSWVLVADDDYSWEGYEYGGDDYVFQAGNSWVSQAQIVYAIAALSFVITGFIDLFAYPGILGIFFILAGIFGLVSAFLLEEDEHLSNIFNLVSVHLFLLEAIGLLTRRSFFGGLKKWIRLADLFFTLGVILDVALSYVYLFNKSNIPLARLEVSAQVFWLVCSVIYIGATLYSKKHGAFDIEESGSTHEGEEHKKVMDDEESPNNITHDSEEDDEEDHAIWDYEVYEGEKEQWEKLSPDEIVTDSSHSGKEHVA